MSSFRITIIIFLVKKIDYNLKRIHKIVNVGKIEDDFIASTV